MRGLLGVICALSLGACVDSATIACGDNICPSSYICTTDERCISQEALAACMNLADGEACSANGAAGQCLDGVCATVVCGNGRIDPGEVCDDGNLANGDGCNATCRSDETCGNGFVDADERCDCGDGDPTHANTACTGANSDAPGATCHLDCTPHACGDGLLEPSEQCEPGMAASATCDTYGFYTGTVGCTANCQFDLAGCQQYCGDGVVQVKADEACDGAPPAGESCLTYGFDRGALTCSASLCRPAFDGCGDLGWVPYTRDSRVFLTISGASTTDVWAGGVGGAALHWNGSTWLDVSNPLNAPVEGIWAAGANEAYMATLNGVQHYVNGNWAQEEFTASLHAIAGNGTTVVAVGNAGTIVMKQNGTWTTQTSNLAVDVTMTGAAVVSSTLAYAIGNDSSNVGVLARYSSGTWSIVPTPRVTLLRAVWARSANDIYIGGSSLLHWDGTSWSAMSTGMDAMVTAISGNSTDVFVAYDRTNGTIAQFDGVAWSIHVTSAAVPQTSLWAAPDGTAYAVASTISHYVGSGWTTAQLGKTLTLRAAGGTSPTTAWAVGDHGFAVRFDGTMWRRIPSAFTTDASEIAGDYVVGSSGAFGHFTGTRVDLIPIAWGANPVADLSAVWTAPNGHVWAVGGGGTLVHYDGTTATATTITNAALFDIWGAASNDIYVVGKNGMMHFNGTSWANMAAPASSLYAIWGTSSTDYYVAGDSAMMQHWDGSAWSQITFPGLSGTFTQMTGANGVVYMTLRAFPSAAAGQIYYYNGGGAIALDGTLSEGYVGIGVAGTVPIAAGTSLQLSMLPGATWQLQLATSFDNHSSVWASSEADVYAAGPSVALLHFDGHVWSIVTTGLPFSPSAVTGSASNDVWVVATKDPLAAHWNGTTWTRVDPPVASEDISALPSARAFVAGKAGALARYTTSWQNDTSGTITVPLFGVHATSTTSAYAVGQAGTVVQWNGSAWSVVSGGPINDLRVVWASSATNVFVAGSNMIAQRSGTTWTTTPVSAQTFTALTGTSATDVFAAGNGGTVMHFDGTSWAPLQSNVTGPITDATATPDAILFSVGLPTSDIRGLRRDVAW